MRPFRTDFAPRSFVDAYNGARHSLEDAILFELAGWMYAEPGEASVAWSLRRAPFLDALASATIAANARHFGANGEVGDEDRFIRLLGYAWDGPVTCC